MRTPVPRVAAVHDLSGFGRASLTMIMPILSTMGIQVCPVPTAILSSHTGGFKGYKFIDLTADLRNTWLTGRNWGFILMVFIPVSWDPRSRLR